MVYVDFDFYEDEYGGTQIAESAFPNLAIIASALIDELTYSRAETVVTDNEDSDLIEKIQFATCSVAEAYQKYFVSGEKDIVSESVGGHSVSYTTTKEMQATKLNKVQAAAKIFLGNTGIMFSGLQTTWPSA